VVSPYQMPKFMVEGVDVKSIKIKHLHRRKRKNDIHASMLWQRSQKIIVQDTCLYNLAEKTGKKSIATEQYSIAYYLGMYGMINSVVNGRRSSTQNFKTSSFQHQ